MKTKNYLVMAAALAAFSACSNNDETSNQKGEEAVSFASMTIRLDAPKTYADVSNSVGTESKLNETVVFVKTTGDDGTAAPSYKAIELKGATNQATVKFPVNATTVYVFSNVPSPALIIAAKACTTEAGFEALLEKIDKGYISKLNTKDGSFLMSGKAMINNAAGTSPYLLPVTLSRDLAKVSFKVNQVSVDKAGVPTTPNILKSVASIEIQRSADYVAPFKFDGANFSGYEVAPAFGHVDYVSDKSDNDGVGTPAGSNYYFKYDWLKAVDGLNAYLFNDFYVLPNYAQLPTTGSVIVLKANVTIAGKDEVRYYRARISDGLTSYITAKNTHYIITASVSGEGSMTPEVPEDMDNQLIVSINVAPWALVLSDQIMGE